MNQPPQPPFPPPPQGQPQQPQWRQPPPPQPSYTHYPAQQHPYMHPSTYQNAYPPQMPLQPLFQLPALTKNSGRLPLPLPVLGMLSIIIGVFLIVGLIYTISGQSSSSTSDGTPTVPTGPAKVGDTIMIDYVSCTVTSVNNFFGPLAIVAHVKLVNNSNGEIQYNTLDFHLETQEGQILDPSSADSTLGSGALAPGGKVEGDILFYIPNIHKGEILWQPGASEDLSHGWDFVLTSDAQTPTP